MNAFLEFVKRHKFTVLFVSLGLVLAILFFTIGFWRTLLLLVILALCFLIGYLLDQSGPDGIKEFFSKLFSKK
ncbi:MAG: DUF2273 domain-containing protein [Eubacteriales bacterium]|nr:DUF2273 domain-containing protein [Eubacteriales bacterium]